MPRHEVYLLWRRKIRRDDEVTLILAVFGIDQMNIRPFRASSMISSIEEIACLNSSDIVSLPFRCVCTDHAGHVTCQHIDLKVYTAARLQFGQCGHFPSVWNDGDLEVTVRQGICHG